jgi:ABC-type branched-subunit amino acid transport system ATPase component
LLQPLASWWQFTYGLIVLGSVLAGRRGLAGIGAQAAGALKSIVRRRTRKGLVATADNVWLQPVLPSRQGATSTLTVLGVTKRYGGVTALESVDVEFKPAMVHALIGPNGSGKSTLLNAITGVAKATAGQITFAGVNLTAKSPDQISRLGVARTFQTPRLFTQVSVMDNVRPMAEVAGYRRRAAYTHAFNCLGTVGLEGYADERASELPQGYRRLLEIARALALAPKVFLLDEPAAGLAEGEWAQLQALLRRLSQAGVCVVVVEHNMPFVLGLADTVTVLQTGHVLAQGTPDEIQQSALVREAYMGA